MISTRPAQKPTPLPRPGDLEIDMLLLTPQLGLDRTGPTSCHFWANWVCAQAQAACSSHNLPREEDPE